ncbi:XrtA-associated tyrosine autokinase [Uliginosibacterium sp. sgz301328]|uniref:XrtA-associated tyrosine autokinase n=1 Tax=Uliginosibacterium sp. sgz301328 TaxID=3243764 RepID=UPI00359E3902
MSIIEKAVERLDQLKRAGVTVDTPEAAAAPVPTPPLAEPVAVAAPVAAPAAAPAESDDEPLATTLPGSRRIEINLERLSSMGMISPLNPRSMLAEEYRVIKRPLLRNVAGRGGAMRNPNLIMVSSSVPGEGKSFTSINLALSIAMELDHTVLLVDADVSRPSVLNLLGLPPAPGLMDVLLSPQVELPDVLLRTNIEKLAILPAGMPHQRATELLASDAMARLLEEMAIRYPDRIIVFDSPPLLVTTEARVLATHMGQIVMVVEAGRTTHSMVKQALSTIESCPVKMMLMNKTREPGPGGYYGYYAPYGYAQSGR